MTAQLDDRRRGGRSPQTETGQAMIMRTTTTPGRSAKIVTTGRSTVTIDHGLIADGDEVRLRDNRGNVITALAKHDGVERQNLYVVAFGARIYFARHTAAGWQRVSGIEVAAHQPGFDFGAQL
jgi:hypothetical protein